MTPEIPPSPPTDVFEPTNEVYLVVTGRRFVDLVANAGSAEYTTFLQVTPFQLEDGLLSGTEKEVVYKRKSLRKYIDAIPGMVYSFQATAHHGLPAIRLYTAHYEGLWPNTAQRAVWQSNDRNVHVKREISSIERKGKEDNSLYESLKTAREVFATVPPGDRDLTIARIVRYITMGLYERGRRTR